jgi:hypothetical protein
LQPEHQNHNQHHIDVELIRAGTIVGTFAVRGLSPNAGPVAGHKPDGRRRRLWQIRLDEERADADRSRPYQADPDQEGPARPRPGRHRKPD